MENCGYGGGSVQTRRKWSFPTFRKSSANWFNSNQGTILTLFDINKEFESLIILLSSKCSHMGQQDSYQTYHRESSLVVHDSRVMMVLLRNIFISLKVFHLLLVHSLILNMEFALENLQQLAKQKLIKKIAHFGFM